MANRPLKQEGDDSLLQEARDRFKLAYDADIDNRRIAEDDLRFCYNFDGDNQWSQEAKTWRKDRPMLTENRMPQFVRQVCNAIRSARPSITVLPAGGQATTAVAEVREGMTRHIEQASRADLAYDTAAEGAIASGAGYFRITTDYVDDSTFDQELVIRTIDNPFCVYDDPKFQSPDGSDRKFCFVTEMVAKKEFKAKYGFEPTAVDSAGEGEDYALWYDKEDVRVAEYHRVTYAESELKDPLDEKNVRTVRTPTVEVYVMTGDTIIERAKYPGCKLLGVVPVFGELKRIGGRLWRKSLIHDAKTNQQLNNYLLSQIVEVGALQPKVPYLGPVGAFTTDRARWDGLAQTNPQYLEFDPVTDGQGNKQYIPPQRQPGPEFPQGLHEIRLGAIEGMKASMGIYDASLGARTNEVSGIAIEQRQSQADVSTYHFTDNVVRAIRYAGLVLNERMPLVYNKERVVRIIKPDGEPEMVAINQAFVTDPQTYQNMPGVRIDTGRYDVVVKAGPSYATQRQETQTMLWQMVKAYPQLMLQAGDLLFKSMDFNGADEIAKRLTPAGGPQVPPQIQQQMQLMQQALDQGKGIIGELQQDKNKLELDNKRKDIEKVALQADAKLRDSQVDPVTQLTMKEREQEMEYLHAERMERLKLEYASRVEQLKTAKAIEAARQVALVKAATTPETTSPDGQDGQDVQAEGDVPTAAEVPEPTALEQAVVALAQTMQALHASMSAPREIVRDAMGRAVGVRPMMMQPPPKEMQ